MTEGSKQSTSNLLHRFISFSSSSSSSASSSSSTPIDQGPVNTEKITIVKEYPGWHNVVAGAVAGAGSRMLTAPLDLLKIRWQLGKEGSMFQTVENMVRKEGGVSSLYRGNVAATYLWVGYAVIQFSLYERTHAWLSHSQLERPKSSLKLPPLIKPIHNWIGSNPTATAFCAGGTAGICATMATYPFDIARTTFAAQGLTDATTKTASSLGFKPPRSLLEFGKQTFQKNGIRGFFVGSGPAILQIIPYMGINFALYDYLSSNQKCINVSQSGW
eukprot:CAMPEP_0197834914 /NCGR_PEP_ID=MMETSP1437-20131217/24119_1 /TAXON_ID=49252 ORGANISM="Eucampia antarctica, Strain CCMP1452" /NCGR_SAMPLE_ID=MMETSP1437 /ASSEMBLY_ACC=CAM_ASM_001096 /LENGTH=272 /DNA_ID=CAMNT_0043439963 /DNA_START=25 /DNA_END=840 /DNA_ORIENTATION=-